MSSISAKRLINKSHRLFIPAAALFVSCFVSCDASRPKAHITPSVSFNRTSAEMGTPVEVNYSFKTSKDFPGLKKDLIVFVHFLDPSGKIRFVDDHNPPLRTNQWGPGRDYSYVRTYFLPENIPAGDYTVQLGMYTPSGKGERFVLNAKQLSDRSYAVGNIKILEPAPENEPQYVSGWYDLERSPNDNWYHWRWIGKSAVARIANPRSNAFLYLKAESERHRFQEPQRITVFLKDQQIDQFEVESSETFAKKFEIPAASLGADPKVDVKLEVDRTFSPSMDGKTGDTRQLGLRVYCLYLTKR
jgi:hypothetical protein